MLISTVIPVYNRAVFLREAVESVLTQSHRPIEVILVDDGSTDDTPMQIEALCRDHPNKIGSIRIENRGPGGAREAGWQQTRGDLIQFLDSDDHLLSTKFEVQLTELERNPQAGIAYGKTRLVDENGTTLKEPYKWTGRKFETLFPALLVDRWWNTQTPLYRREVVERAGSWSDMRMSEDWEFEARVGGLGTKLVFCDEYVCETRQHPGNRLTGKKEGPASLRDRLRLLESLFENACQVNVSLECPEMRHFSRWCFFTSRQCGCLKLAAEAKHAFELAKASSVLVGTQLKLYQTMAEKLGWCHTARLTKCFERVRAGRTGKNTQCLSWAQ